MKIKVWIYSLVTIILLGIIAGVPLFIRQKAEIIIAAQGTNEESLTNTSTAKDSTSSDAVGEASAALGNVQEPAPIDGKNMALNKTVTTDSNTQSYYAANTVDGDVITYWEGAANAYPNKLTVDMGKASSIKTVRIKLNPDPMWDKRTQTFSISGSTDDTTYNKIVDSAAYTFDPEASNTVTIDFNAVSVRYVRFEFTANTGSAAGQAAEIEVY